MNPTDKTRKKSIWFHVALGCYLPVGLSMVAIGLFYLSLQRLMPYHEQALGTAWEQIPAAYQTLLLALLHGGGSASLATGLAILILLCVPFRRLEGWSRWALLAIAAPPTLVLLRITVTLRLERAAQTPWPLVALGLILLLVGFVSSFFWEKGTAA